MNKRILELWAQADKLAKDAMDDVPRRSYNDVLMEKFAGLIVRECIAQCWSVSELEHKGYVISECSKRMRKHFGVEE